jgi:hypothetical protein
LFEVEDGEVVFG